MGGPHHWYFAYVRASGRFRPFIIRSVLPMLRDIAVIGVFSVVLAAVWGNFGIHFPHLGGVPGARGGFPDAPGGLLRAPLGLLGAFWISQADAPSFFGAPSHVQEALGIIWGPLLWLLGVILTLGTEPPRSKHMIAEYS